MKQKTSLKIIEAALVIGLLAFFYCKDLASVTFHIDESHWIGSSYMFEAYFKGEFWSDAWRENQHTVTNPPVPRYFIGISRFLAGYRIPDLNRAWEYTRNRNFNLRMGAMPSDGLLWWSRLPMAVLAVLSIWIGFLFIKLSNGRLAAYIWIGFCIASSYLLLQTRRAMAEAPILFCVMLAAWLCYLALKNIEDQPTGIPRRTWIYFALSGICIGLAGESKMNGLSAALGVVLASAPILWTRREAPVSKIRYGLLGAALVALTTTVAFLGSYPYLWPDLLGRTIHVFQNRVDEMKYQASMHAPDAIYTIEQRMAIIPTRIFDDYASFHFPGALYLNLGLTVLGTIIVLIHIRSKLKDGEPVSAPLTLLAFGLTAAVPTLFTLLDWDRYYLFPVFFSSMAIAIAIAWLLKKLYGQVRGIWGRAQI